MTTTPPTQPPLVMSLAGRIVLVVAVPLLWVVHQFVFQQQTFFIHGGTNNGGSSWSKISLLLIPPFQSSSSTTTTIAAVAKTATTTDATPVVRNNEASSSSYFLPNDNNNNSGFPAYLYHALQEPYRSYPCLPKRRHVAQRNDVALLAEERETSSSRAAAGEEEEENKDHNYVVSMTLSFSLDYERCATARPVILYGREKNNNSSTRPEGVIRLGPPKDGAAIQFNYTSDYSNGSYQSDWIYHVEIPDLLAGLELYWYRIVVEQQEEEETTTTTMAAPRRTTAQRRSLVGDDDLNVRRRRRGASGLAHLVGDSPRFSFRTPPLPTTPTGIAFVGDLGQTENSTITMAHIWRAATNTSTSSDNTFVSHLVIAGDLSYADSDPYRWTSWMETMEPLLRTTAVHVAAGNHEIECDNTTRDIFVPYEHWFYNPNRIRDAQMKPVTEDYRKTLWHQSCSAPSTFQGVYDYGNSFYSYRHGLAHVIVLNSYTDAAEGSPQYQWFLRELQNNVNRTLTPWLIVTFHSPLYTTFLGHVNEIESVRMKKAMEPLFLRHQVNLIVSGHDHAYMRTHPMYNGEVVASENAPVYWTLGAGGNREHHAAGYRNESHPEPWVARRDLKQYGYGHLFLPNKTHARLAWVRDGILPDDDDDNIMHDDRVWLRNYNL